MGLKSGLEWVSIDIRDNLTRFPWVSSKTASFQKALDSLCEHTQQYMRKGCLKTAFWHREYKLLITRRLQLRLNAMINRRMDLTCFCVSSWSRGRSATICGMRFAKWGRIRSSRLTIRHSVTAHSVRTYQAKNSFWRGPTNTEINKI